MRLLLLLSLVVSIAVAHATPPCCATKAAPSEKETVLWHKLEAEIHVIDTRLDGVAAVAIEDLSTGHTLFLNPDEVFPQASSIKITVLAELYRQHQEGRLKLGDLYTVNAADLVPDSSIMG